MRTKMRIVRARLTARTTSSETASLRGRKSDQRLRYFGYSCLVEAVMVGISRSSQYKILGWEVSSCQSLSTSMLLLFRISWLLFLISLLLFLISLLLFLNILAPLPCASVPLPWAFAPLPYAFAPLPYTVAPRPYVVAPLPSAFTPLRYTIASLSYAFAWTQLKTALTPKWAPST